MVGCADRPRSGPGWRDGAGIATAGGGGPLRVGAGGPAAVRPPGWGSVGRSPAVGGSRLFAPVGRRGAVPGGLGPRGPAGRPGGRDRASVGRWRDRSDPSPWGRSPAPRPRVAGPPGWGALGGGRGNLSALRRRRGGRGGRMHLREGAFRARTAPSAPSCWRQRQRAWVLRLSPERLRSADRGLLRQRSAGLLRIPARGHCRGHRRVYGDPHRRRRWQGRRLGQPQRSPRRRGPVLGTLFNGRRAGRFSFVCTPVRAFWLGRIGIWSSALGCRLLRRGGFPVIGGLDQRVGAFVRHCGERGERPYR